MAQFINIEGVLINLDNVVRVIRHKDGQMMVEFNKSITDVELARMCFEDTPAARAAYEWLKRTCVATFLEDELISKLSIAGYWPQPGAAAGEVQS